LSVNLSFSLSMVLSVVLGIALSVTFRSTSSVMLCVTLRCEFWGLTLGEELTKSANTEH